MGQKFATMIGTKTGPLRHTKCTDYNTKEPFISGDLGWSISFAPEEAGRLKKNLQVPSHNLGTGSMLRSFPPRVRIERTMWWTWYCLWVDFIEVKFTPSVGWNASFSGEINGEVIIYYSAYLDSNEPDFQSRIGTRPPVACNVYRGQRPPPLQDECARFPISCSIDYCNSRSIPNPPVCNILVYYYCRSLYGLRSKLLAMTFFMSTQRGLEHVTQPIGDFSPIHNQPNRSHLPLSSLEGYPHQGMSALSTSTSFQTFADDSMPHSLPKLGETRCCEFY